MTETGELIEIPETSGTLETFGTRVILALSAQTHAILETRAIPETHGALGNLKTYVTPGTSVTHVILGSRTNSGMNIEDETTAETTTKSAWSAWSVWSAPHSG